MRRELKDSMRGIPMRVIHSHKAYPDEKGTESTQGWIQLRLFKYCHKAYPDEKGTERPGQEVIIKIATMGHKAYPDEKGTESGATT